MKTLLEAIPAEIKDDFPKVVENLNVEYRTTLASDDEASQKKRAALHKRYTAAGGAQDGVVARCHQAARLLRFQAGMTLSPDPVAAEIALEVRRRASAVLQNPMYHETKDRHRM